MGKITKDSLGDRMKQYESVNDNILVPKIPFIIRIDGKAFHTFTRGLDKPFDVILQTAMLNTTESLCKDIPGAVIGYTQSDEITIVCKYSDRIRSQAWYNGRIRKIETIAASKATKYFNKHFFDEISRFRNDIEFGLVNRDESTNIDLHKKLVTYERKLFLAEFDARVFNVPEWDCINNIIWRQQDAIRNSVEAVGHANFSTKELYKVNCENIKVKLLNEKGIDWETTLDAYEKYGAFCIYNTDKLGRNKWTIDREVKFIVQDERDRFKELTGLIED